MPVRGARTVRAFRGINRAEIQATLRKLSIIATRDSKQPNTNKILTDPGRAALVQLEADLGDALAKRVPKF